MSSGFVLLKLATPLRHSRSDFKLHHFLHGIPCSLPASSVTRNPEGKRNKTWDRNSAEHSCVRYTNHQVQPHKQIKPLFWFELLYNILDFNTL